MAFLSFGVKLLILPLSIILSTLFKMVSKAPFVNIYFLPSNSPATLISFLSESNASSAIRGYFSLYSNSFMPCFCPSTVSAISVGSPMPCSLWCVLSFTIIIECKRIFSHKSSFEISSPRLNAPLT